MKKQGFTLIELIIVIAIIGLLASMIVPAIQKARQQEKAKEQEKMLLPPDEQQRKNYSVEFLFEINGTKVYRFYDSGYGMHYVTIDANKKSQVLEKPNE